MSEYIEREAIQKRLNRIVEVNNLRTDLAWFTPYGVKALIEEIPATDVVPVRHGKWVYNPGDNIPYCSECMMPQDSECNYCPSCGADMREES